MGKAIFVGPSLSRNTINSMNIESSIMFLENIKLLNKINIQENDLFILPPIQGGEAYFLSNIPEIKAVGIIDGYFENTISAWHKELLYLISKNIFLIGSASMGALRAAELNTYGMQGIGVIFEDFLSGALMDDDEVTIAHGPAEMGYPNISEAMVNIRATVKKALTEKILTEDYAKIFLKSAKETFYKNRNYGYIIQQCVNNLGLKRKMLDSFSSWIQTNRIDQKAVDSQQMIHFLLSHLDTEKKETSFHMEDTLIWRKFIDQ